MKNGFLKGLLIYVISAVVIIAAGLVVFWNYISAYEMSRTDGVMERYMAEDLNRTLQHAVQNFVEQEPSAFESGEERKNALQGMFQNGEWSYRKDAEQFMPETPVYKIFLDKEELGGVRLASEPGGLFSFGLSRWIVSESYFDLNRLTETYAVYAPEDAAVTVNGVPLNVENCSLELDVPEELEPYAGDLAQLPGWVKYSFTAVSLPEVRLASDSEEYWMSWDETNPGVFSVTQQSGTELSGELHTYVQDFVRAYVAYTSHATGGPGQVQSYMVPGGSLYERMTASMDGMSWVHGVTSTMSELTADDLHYYGCAATLTARYVLTGADGERTDNEMKVILTLTDSGWKVANIELQ